MSVLGKSQIGLFDMNSMFLVLNVLELKIAIWDDLLSTQVKSHLDNDEQQHRVLKANTLLHTLHQCAADQAVKALLYTD